MTRYYSIHGQVFFSAGTTDRADRPYLRSTVVWFECNAGTIHVFFNKASHLDIAIVFSKRLSNAALPAPPIR